MESKNKWEALWPTTQNHERHVEPVRREHRPPVFGLLATVGAIIALVGAFGPWFRVGWRRIEVLGTESPFMAGEITAVCATSAILGLVLSLSFQNRYVTGIAAPIAGLLLLPAACLAIFMLWTVCWMILG